MLCYPGHLAWESYDGIPGVAKHLVNFVSLYVTNFYEFSFCFCAPLTVKYGRFFTLVLFGHMDKKKVEKFDPEKRLDFRFGSNFLII